MLKTRPPVDSQGRAKRKFDASLPSAAGELRLDTATLNLDRNQLGSVPRAYEGINAVALLMAERHPAVVRSG